MVEMRGFTLIELLIVVAILGIISAIGMPVYVDYVDTSRATVVQNNLRAIYLQQLEYFTNNNAYYSTGATCSDSTTAIHTNLFSGSTVLDNTYYDFCILQTTTTDFTARAEEKSGSNVYTINQNNVTSF